MLATSANACRAMAGHKSMAALRALPLFVVGPRTAQAAAAAGFSCVTSADGALDDLAALVAARLTDKTLPLLYLAGADRAGDLAGALAAHGLEIHTRVVYRAVPEAQLPPAICAALAGGDIDGVLHFSARSAQAFLAAAAAAGLSARSLDIQHYCLSAQVAAPLAAAGAAAISVAPRPNERALVDALSL
jgi:uroporphyrinogen-III synthase